MGRPVRIVSEVDGSLMFWRVEVPGCEPWHSPPRAKGDEAPAFFRWLAEIASQRTSGLTDQERDGV
jgi:hypothetical protein